MKNRNLIILLGGFLLSSFLFSGYTQAPMGKRSPIQKDAKKKQIIKAKDNTGLKEELIQLEEQFKKDHEAIKIQYKQRIS